MYSTNMDSCLWSDCYLLDGYMQVEANRSADEYDPSHQHRARRSLKNAALGKYVYISIHYCGYDCLFATIILSDMCEICYWGTIRTFILCPPLYWKSSWELELAKISGSLILGDDKLAIKAQTIESFTNLQLSLVWSSVSWPCSKVRYQGGNDT